MSYLSNETPHFIVDLCYAMSNSPNANGDDHTAAEELQAAQSVFEQFLLSSPYLKASADNNVKLKNTFIEVEESDDFVSQLGYRSSTCPADISDEIYQLARTITKDLPLMATIVEGLEANNHFDISGLSSGSSPTQNGQSFALMTPTVYAPAVIPEDPDMSIETNYTTVMLRNIPNKYTQSSLLEAVDAKGFHALYNFFYLPVDFKNGCNMGYAFINFVDHSAATRFVSSFKGYQLPAKSSKVCDACWARVQGFKANIEHYRNSPVNDLPDPEYRPLMFQNGAEVPFPRPDANIAKRSSARRKTSPHSYEGNAFPSRTSTLSTGSSHGFAESHAAVKLFIGGLSAGTKDEDIRSHFAQFGEVVDAAVVIDKKTGISRGFAFCALANREAADKVMHTRQHLINGQSVGVRFYQQGK